MTEKKKRSSTSKNNDNLNSAIRVTSEVGILLKNEVDKLNKRKNGSRKINVSEVIKMSLSLLNDGHRTQVLAKTVTSEDRQKVAFENYSRNIRALVRLIFLILFSTERFK